MNIPLNIDWQQILLHMFNFLILFAAMFFLLYKPIREFMEKREAEYAEREETARKNLEQSEKTKIEYEHKLKAADDEINAKRDRAFADTVAANEALVKKTRQEAAEILENAHAKTESEHKRMLEDAQSEISDMVAEVAKKVVMRSGSDGFNQFLDTAEKGEKHD